MNACMQIVVEMQKCNYSPIIIIAANEQCTQCSVHGGQPIIILSICYDWSTEHSLQQALVNSRYCWPHFRLTTIFFLTFHHSNSEWSHCGFGYAYYVSKLITIESCTCLMLFDEQKCQCILNYRKQLNDLQNNSINSNESICWLNFRVIYVRTHAVIFCLCKDNVTLNCVLVVWALKNS